MIKSFLLILSMLAIAPNVHADGSRNMFPKGSKGYRASLWSSYDCINETNPFPTVGVMKVYAKAGEFILLGSSTIGKYDSEHPDYGKGAIGYRAPNGVTEMFNDKAMGGRIDNRAQELAGPNYNGTITDGFTPISIEVAADQEGVWEIYFLSPTYKHTYNSDESAEKYSIENWKQNNNDGTVMAFDISVCDASKSKLIPGRAYTNVLNMVSIKEPDGVSYASSWYSTLYVLTEVGYTYRVQTNGLNPHYGTFFSNNKGIQKEGTGSISVDEYLDPFSGERTGYKSYQGGDKSYKSMSYTEGAETGFIYDPRLQDNRELIDLPNGESVWKYEDVTHKIFFCRPASDLPESAVAVYGTNITDTWLKTPAAKSPKMENLAIRGNESGAEGEVGPEGASISFDAGVAGSFSIKMVFSEGYETRIIEGVCVKGHNIVQWDRKDGKGNSVALDKGAKIELSGQLIAAEVHFPFVDLENNENGYILELVDADDSAIFDVLYWDDTDVQSDPTGTDFISSLTGASSASGAHKWTLSNSSGDKNIVDTWTYVKISSDVVTVEPKISILDLTVNEAKTLTPSAAVGQEITFELKVENLHKTGVEFNGENADLSSDADSAAIGVWLSEGGFHVTSIAVVESDDEKCKVLQQPSGKENSIGYIRLANGKTATIEVKGYADESLANKTITPQAYIMRPGDVYEIDAENISNDGLPSNPKAEYAGTNNNIVDCSAIAITGNEKPVISDKNTEKLNVSIKAENGKSYSESPIMLPVAIYDPENTPVNVTLSGDDAALFKVDGPNIYYVGTTPATGDEVIYNITATAKDENGATTVREIAVTVILNKGALKDSELNVETTPIKYGQPLSEAITKMETSDSDSEGKDNGTWIIRKEDGSIVKEDDVLDAGTYPLTFSYYSDKASDYESGSITKTVEVNPRTITITSEGKTKEYDGEVLKNEKVTLSGDGVYGSDNISATNFSSLKNVGKEDNKFEIVYAAGTNSKNYEISPVYGSLEVTPKALTVEGAKVANKEYDGTTTGVVTETGTLVGVVEGDKVEINTAEATFPSDEVGTDKATISFTLKGEDAPNYIVKDTTVEAIIVPKADEFTWVYDKPVYGDNVGTSEEVSATYIGTALENGGTYTYFVDDKPVNNTDLIVPGSHVVKVVYTDPNSNTAEAEKTIEFGKATLSPVTDVTKEKQYDGNNNAKAEVTGITGKVNEADDVNVEVSSAKYDNKNVGTGKEITVDYELTGDNADYYTVKENDIYNDGVITKADKDAPVVNGGTTTGEGKKDGPINGLTPEMEISKDNGTTWDPVTDPEVGFEAGDYEVRYGETDTTKASAPTKVTVTDPTNPWIITNPELTYGDAKVGDTEKAEYKD
ncbi:MAG: YDG domain-containing protein, partial [Paludibacteraceae bacterium]|nr:YDG domain-containing protein [Paludibacteraceae bacterium]